MDIQEKSNNAEYVLKKRKKKKLKRLFFWIKFIMISALFVTTLVLLSLSPLFNITSIEVKGSQKYKEADIIDATGVIMGNNGFKTIGSSIGNIVTFRYGNAEENIIKNYPYVKNVVVRYVIPGKIKVSITERKPAVVTSFMGSYLVLDEDAYVLEAVDKKAIPKGLPLVKGMKFESFKIGQALKMSDKEAFNDALKLIQEIKASDSESEQKIFSKVDSIDVSDRSKIRLLFDSRITINMGNLDNASYRITFARKIILEKLKKADRGILDMTIENPHFKPEK